MVRPLWKTAWDFLRRLDIGVPQNPAVPLLGVHPREPKTCPHRNVRMDVHRAMVTIAQG